ncbi:MAG: DNA-formamidopyrimidine glycosylase [Bacteroides sp.]|nr:DNA-formamidopyrimidine glycosylase [Prevotella sp.]MCM1407810.1 DNA-formamidopyrimidine glycosylase [Treponema brennaborense]MCM1468842.1 DNA-formamidopyrimidine glycosylase [Bacteroides sp.]
MPELPEAETVKRVIEPQIADRKIIGITVNRPEVIAYPDSKVFCAAVNGLSISGMARRGKFLQILLQNGGKIIIHLRMTGCVLVMPCGGEIEKHTHVILHLDDGQDLRFTDTRRFGRWWYIPAQTQDTYSGIHKLGLEPFDENLTAEYLKEKLGRRRKPVKECLLDQSVIAGIGNIYSDEILYAAKIRPCRSAGELTDEDYLRLVNCIKERLAYFIEKNFITSEEYLLSRGQDYRNTPYLQVYGRAEKPCRVCGTILQKTVIGGRSSVFCPNCQK